MRPYISGRLLVKRNVSRDTLALWFGHIFIGPDSQEHLRYKNNPLLVNVLPYWSWSIVLEIKLGNFHLFPSKDIFPRRFYDLQISGPPMSLLYGCPRHIWTYCHFDVKTGCIPIVLLLQDKHFHFVPSGVIAQVKWVQCVKAFWRLPTAHTTRNCYLIYPCLVLYKANSSF